VPAAGPVALQWASDRTDALTSSVADKHLLAPCAVSASRDGGAGTQLASGRNLRAGQLPALEGAVDGTASEASVASASALVASMVGIIAHRSR